MLYLYFISSNSSNNLYCITLVVCNVLKGCSAGEIFSKQGQTGLKKKM